MRLVTIWTICGALSSVALLGCPNGNGDVDGGGDGAPPDGEWHEVTLSPAGGTHDVGNGLTVAAPPGAVEEDTPIKLRRVSYDELAFLYGPLEVPEEDVVFSVEAEPDGLVFDKAITITSSASGLKAYKRYLLYIVDVTEQQGRSAAGTALTVDFAAKTVAVELSHFSTPTVGAIPPEQQECHPANPSAATNCKCAGFSSRSSDRDALCTAGDCVISKSLMVMDYFACPEGSFESDWQEVTDGCEATMEMSAARTVIPAEESENIHSTVKLGCAPWPDVNVGFSKVSGVGYLETSDDVTDDNGKAVALFHAGSDEGEATIEASADFEYWTQRISNGGVQEEGAVKKSASASKSISVFVYERPILDLLAEPSSVEPDATATIRAKLTRKGEPVPDGIRVDFTETTGLAKLSEPSTTTSSGAATVTLTAGEETGTARVHATATIPVPVPGRSPEDVLVEGDVPVEIGEGTWTATVRYSSRVESHGTIEEVAYTFELTFALACCPGEPARVMIHPDSPMELLTATASQTATTLAATDPDEWIGTVYAPASVEVEVDGNTVDDHLLFTVWTADGSFFFEYELCDEHGCDRRPGGISAMFVGDDMSIPLEEGTWSGGFTDPYHTRSYTVTLRRGSS